MAGELRAAVRRSVDVARGNWAEALAAIGVSMRPHLRSPKYPAFIREIERDLGPFAGATLRALVAQALAAEPDATRALSAAYERIDPDENPELAATVDRERRNLMACAVYRLVRAEAEAWKRRQPHEPAFLRDLGDDAGLHRVQHREPRLADHRAARYGPMNPWKLGLLAVALLALVGLLHAPGVVASQPEPGGADGPTKPLSERTPRWRCDPSRKVQCDRTGCRDLPPTVWVMVDFEARHYQRCDRTGCDTYAVRWSTSGIYTLVEPIGTSGTFLKAVNDGREYVEVASLGTVILASYGRCSPRP